MAYRVIGRPEPRIEVAGKVTGAARYTSDVLLPDTLWAKVLRSPYPHARILRIDTFRAERAPGVAAVLTGHDVAGIIYGRRYRDIPVLAQDRVRYAGERVAAVAAETLDAARDALDLIEVEYDELPAVLDPLEALQENAPILHPDVNSYYGLPEPLEKPSNAYVRELYTRGDIAKGFAEADVIVENRFTVSRVHQGFIEPHCCLMWIDKQGRVQVWSPNKVPHGLKETLAVTGKIAKENIRINPVSIGGDFGGKGAPMDEPICYFLARRTGKPVKMVMEYQEELSAGAPRHAAVIDMRTGVKRDGRMVAHQARVILDSGAYGGFRPGAVVGGAAHGGALYNVPNSHIETMRVYTNNLPGGQMRAPGEPQAFFAAESQIDCVARRLGMDPVEFRLKNLIREGDETLVGQRFQGIKARETLSAAVRAAKYESAKPKAIGRGVAMGYRAPGGGATSVGVELKADGSVTIHTSYYEQGTGTYTTLRQVVAEELGLKPSAIRIQIVDTDLGVPFDTGIGGSRGTRVASGAAYRAACDVKEEIFAIAEKLLGWSRQEMTFKGQEIARTKTGQRQRWAELLSRAEASVFRLAINRDDERSPVTSFAAQVAEVSVDRETGQVTLHRLTTAHDTGVIVNPIGHQGQIEGGVVQGVGYGLIEQVSVDQGRVMTLNFGDYKLPTVKDIPKLDTVIVKGDAGVGPYKIKGIGENPISPVAPAIANAIEDAVGARIRDLPITAEKIYRALQEKSTG